MKKIYLVPIFFVATLGMSACSSKQNSQTTKESSKSSQSSRSSSITQSTSSTTQSSSIIKESSSSIEKSISPSTSTQIRNGIQKKINVLQSLCQRGG